MVILFVIFQKNAILHKLHTEVKESRNNANLQK